MFNLFLLSARWLGFRSPTGRRAGGLLLWTFAIAAVALVALVSVPSSRTWLLLLSFALFGPVLAAATNLQSVHPGELFPTHLRVTGVGVATAINRIGACLGTFLLPIAIDRFGVQVSLYGLAAVLVLGFAHTQAWAPQTQDLELAEASRVRLPAPTHGDSR